MISIVNYGSGNIQAISNILDQLRIEFVVSARPEDLSRADRVILPGVGAFDQAMHELDRSGLRQALDKAVLEDKKPILGICVGMQLLARSSEEGKREGLGWIDGDVKKFDNVDVPSATYLPHMGWNSVRPLAASALFAGIDLDAGYYFLHSYYFRCNDDADQLAITDYGIQFTSVVHRGNIYGVQFHPEKSHLAGVQLIRNFAESDSSATR